MGLFSCLNDVFASHRPRRHRRFDRQSRQREEARPKSIASELDTKEMMINDEASYSRAPVRREERVARVKDSSHAMHNGIVRSSSSLDQLEGGNPDTPPLHTAPSTPTSPPMPSSSSLASIGRPTSPRHMGSPKSTRSKVSFTGSEGTFRSNPTAMTGKMVGAPTHYQTNDGRQEFTSRVYTSENTKKGRRRRG